MTLEDCIGAEDMPKVAEAYKYRVTIGDVSGNANAVVTNDMARAEQYASRMLGREWGDLRMISVATFYEWDGTAYKFHSEMEY
jgi:hypothetical protein